MHDCANCGDIMTWSEEPKKKACVATQSGPQKLSQVKESSGQTVYIQVSAANYLEDMKIEATPYNAKLPLK